MKIKIYLKIAALSYLVGCGEPARLEKKDIAADSGVSAADAETRPADAEPVGGIPSSAGSMAGQIATGGMVNPTPNGEDAGAGEMAGQMAVPTGGMVSDQPDMSTSPPMDANEPPCQVLHSDENPLAETPGTSRSVLVYDGGPLHFVWADSNGVHSCKIGVDGTFQGARLLVDAPDFNVDYVTSLRVNGIPWVAYGSEGHPIRIFQAHRPRETLLALGTPGQILQGKPLLGDAMGQLMIVGQTPQGALGWHVVSDDLGEQSTFQQTTTFGTQRPTSLGAMSGGVLFRLENAGQCLYLSPPNWAASASVDCYFYPGELLTDGNRSLLWTKETTDSGTKIRLRDLFNPDNSLSIGKFFAESPYLTAQIFRGHKPLISERIITSPEQRLGDLQLVLATYNNWWESRITWGEAGWPYATTAAAIGFMDLPDRVSEGSCEGTDPPTPCSSDSDCSLKSTICVGASEQKHALVVELPIDSPPRIQTIPLIERKLLTQGILFDQDPECVPTPEICDRKDQDCDLGAVADDGLCCTQTSLDADGQINPLIAESDFVTDGAVEEFLIGERTDNDSTHYVAYRYVQGGTSRWKAMRVTYPIEGGVHFGGQNVSWLNNESLVDHCTESGCTELVDCNRPPTSPVSGYQSACKNITKDTLRNFSFDLEAGEGHSLTVLGGLVALIARITQAGDTQGRWGLKWIHYDRNVKPSNDTSPLIALPEACETILAVAPLKRGPDEESIVVVCPDRVLRYYANASRVGEVMLRDDGSPRLNYNDKVVAEYPEPTRTNFLNCEDAAFGNDPNTCVGDCATDRQLCVRTHLACPGCPNPVELPEAPYRFPDQEWRFSDAILGGFNQILWATVQHGIEQGSLVDRFDLFVGVPSPGQIILRAYRFRADQDTPEIIEAPPGPSRGVDDFLDPVFFQEQYPIKRVGPPVRIRQDQDKAQAHLIFTEGGQAIDEQEYVSREVLTGAHVDEIQFSQFHEGRGDGGMLMSAQPINDAGNGTYPGRAYFATSTRESLGRINLWSLAPLYVENRPVADWYLSQSVDAQYRLIQISNRPSNDAPDAGRLWTLSAIPTRCIEQAQ